MNMIPINPVRDKNNALAVLVAELGPELARPVPLPEGANPFQSGQVDMGALSISLAASLSVGTIFGGSVSANDRGYYWDIGAFTDVIAADPKPGGITATRWGVALRVLLRVRDLSGSASLGISMVGAAVELNMAQARYEILGLGIGIDGLLLVLDELPALGDFTHETYLKLNGAVMKKMAAYINDNIGALHPQPLAVHVDRDLDPISRARAVLYAVRAIAGQQSLRGALDLAPVGLDRETVRSVYKDRTGNLDPAVFPGQAAIREASAWLKV